MYRCVLRRFKRTLIFLKAYNDNVKVICLEVPEAYYWRMDKRDGLATSD
jgi:hypothetical protein